MRVKSLILFLPILFNGAQTRQATEFSTLVERLSEPGGYFDSDNLISNETSYLHVMPALRRQQAGGKGTAYLGVGPEQSFSYLAELKPEYAFIVDIRRDNLLLHLLLKTIFSEASNRMEYLALLYGRPIPSDLERWTGRPLEDLLLYLDAVKPDSAAYQSSHAKLLRQVVKLGVPITSEDQLTLKRFHDEFFGRGLEIRFASRGRPVRLSYPSSRQLYLATDLEDNLASYLSTEDRFLEVKRMQDSDRIIPVVGDLSGPKAVKAVGDYLREKGLTVSAFYLSNVEFYLFRSGTFPAFVANVRSLPGNPNSVLIRSVFNRTFAHPQWVPGHLSVQLMQSFDAFLSYSTQPEMVGYWDLLESEHLPLGPFDP